MPIGAFIARLSVMKLLSNHPKLGHITTFGGHPVIAAAGYATISKITSSNLMKEAIRKEQLIRKLLVHDSILELRGKGLMLAAIVKTPEFASKIILKCLKKGLILFWLLFEDRALRITPPLTISDHEIEEGCNIILAVLNDLM